MLQQPLPMASFRNQGLFADHYLQDVLPQQPELWITAGMEAVRAELRTLWHDQAPKVAAYNEAQLEEHFIRPVLRALGHVFEVQPPAGQHQPDYGFFAEEAARDGARPVQGQREYWRHALAVGDAKSWERKLDRQLMGGAAWDFVNPSFQVYYYLAETGCRWGLLTNGRHWRLYSGHPKPDLQAFYEVDLPALLETEDADAFAYFWLFFRREALLPGADGRSFLDRVRDESDRAAERLREDVRDQVYRALLEACRGFLGHEPNQLADADLGEVHDNALVLLYRLLFVLYAEAAELLPVRANSSYRERYSLEALKREVADPGSFAPRLVTLWPGLQALFRIIDGGDPDLGVPAYNGGLFGSAQHPFLEEHVLPDQALARVLDLLARTSAAGFVDYRDLGIRHLGSIYEGLLEYKLARAREPMLVVRRQSKDLWVPAAEVASPRPDAERCAAGDLYLATDRGERKATGSYYTPQYIVEYIVENTLGPLVEECPTAEDLLKLRVLDPAMGSGHFLVEATDFLARKLLEREASSAVADQGTVGAARVGAPAPDESDLLRLKRLVVERCIYGVDLNPLAVELAKLSLWLDTVAQGQPLSFLDHHLRCGNSLIGARVADLPAAPQTQAKRSRRSAQQEAAGQLALFDYAEFTRHANRLVFGFGEIGRALSDTREAVQHKGEILRQIEAAHRRPYCEIADLWCSRWFGNDYGADTYNELVRHLQQGGDGLSESARAALARSRDIAAQQRFLHWELEFPEVFFDEFGRKQQDPGFDAVVGNPPWVRAGYFPTNLAEYLRRAYRTTRGKFDLYVPFVERSLSLASAQGQFGYIVPNKFLGNDYGRALRSFIAETSLLRAVIDTADSPVFPDTTTYPCVLLVAGSGGSADERVLMVEFPSGSVSRDAIAGGFAEAFEQRSGPQYRSARVDRAQLTPGLPWRLAVLARKGMLDEVWRVALPLGDLGVVVFKGVETCLKRVYIDGLDAATRSRCSIEEPLLRPTVDGADVSAYDLAPPPHKVVLFPYTRDMELADLRLFPGAAAYLEEHRLALERRRWWGQTVLGAGLAWYAMPFVSRHIAEPKIVYPDISLHAGYALDLQGDIVPHKTCYCMTLPRDMDARCLLALLNSELLDALLKGMCPPLAQGYYRYQAQFVCALPIRLIDFAHPTSPADKQRLLAQCMAALEVGDYETPLRLATQALAAHAALHGPGGKPELREAPYWRAVATSADPAFPGREDFVHDLLASLTQRMMDLNRRKQEETAKFLQWLEWYVGCPVEELNGKTLVHAFYENETAKLLDVLARNRQRLSKPIGAQFVAEVTREHGQAVAAISPLREALQRTDRLVDLVVYRLYGLTEEEIRIVEGEV